MLKDHKKKNNSVLFQGCVYLTNYCGVSIPTALKPSSLGVTSLNNIHVYPRKFKQDIYLTFRKEEGEK